MYQYIATLHKGKKVIAEGHNLEDVEKQIVHFKRAQKYHEHTKMNEPIDIYHVFRDEGKGKRVHKLIKTL